MRRREFVGGLMGAAAWPIMARGQRGELSVTSRRVALIMGTAARDPEAQIRIDALRSSLMQEGWQTDRNLELLIRYTNGDAKLIQAHSKEIVSLHPDVIVANTSGVASAVKQETTTIPVVFVVVPDP